MFTCPPPPLSYVDEETEAAKVPSAFSTGKKEKLLLKIGQN